MRRTDCEQAHRFERGKFAVVARSWFLFFVLNCALRKGPLWALQSEGRAVGRAGAAPPEVSRTAGVCCPACKEKNGRAARGTGGGLDASFGGQLCLLLSAAGGRSGRSWLDPPPQDGGKPWGSAVVVVHGLGFSMHHCQPALVKRLLSASGSFHFCEVDGTGISLPGSGRPFTVTTKPCAD